MYQIKPDQKNKLKLPVHLLTATLFSLLMATAQSSSATTYTVIDLGSLGGSYSYASAINNAGQVTGHSFTNNNSSGHAFLYSSGTMQDLGVFNGNYSQATGINNLGQVVGDYGFYSGLDRRYGDYDSSANPFVYTNGNMQDLGTLGGDYSYAYGINNLGQVVGTSRIAGNVTSHAFLYSNQIMHDISSIAGVHSIARDINDFSQVVGKSDNHAFLYENGVMRDLGTLGGGASSATSINNAGQVVGMAENSAYYTRAFLYTNGIMQDLGTFGGNVSYATDINNLGQVVGGSYSADGTFHPFLYDNGTMLDLLSNFDTSWSWPGGGYSLFINDNGQIAGTAYHNGNSAAFIMTPEGPAPVPEPSSLFLFGSGLALLWRNRFSLFLK